MFYFALMPFDLHGLGDFPNYFYVVSLPGFPYFDYWTEYPPLFAFTLELLNFITHNNQFLFDFLLYFIISVSGSLCIWLFSKIAIILKKDNNEVLLLTAIYFSFLAFVSYSWWYFDLVVVSFSLFSIYYLLKMKDPQAGIFLSLGVLSKWFPLILLPTIYKYKGWKSFVKILLITVILTLIIWATLLLISPDMTIASLVSQPSRSSWQTIWALIDGNLNTGAFVPTENRLDPTNSTLVFGNPAKIPAWMTLIFFGGLGLIIMHKIRNYSHESMLAFIGITWILFLLWSPGWSPQWILYLFPLILLTLPHNTGLLITFLLSFISLLEWPVLLGRQLFLTLWLIVPIRILIFLVLLFLWYGIITKKNDTHQPITSN
ncbi:MAG TPA: hypothetical protein VK856_08595 [Anaerolineaceae bacterium]|nr:hypothetical protein [Anaerolineaceae bacterium]